MTTPVELRRVYYGFGEADKPANPPFGAFYNDFGNDTLAQWDGSVWQVVGGGSRGGSALTDKDLQDPAFSKAPFIGLNAQAAAAMSGASVGASGYGTGGGGGGVTPAPSLPGDPPLIGPGSAAPTNISVYSPFGSAGGVQNAGQTNVEQTWITITFLSGVNIPATTTWAALLNLVLITGFIGPDTVTWRVRLNGVLYASLVMSDDAQLPLTLFAPDPLATYLGLTPVVPGDVITITGQLSVVGPFNSDIWYDFSAFDMIAL